MQFRDLIKFACLTLTCATAVACDDVELDERDDEIAAPAAADADAELRAVAEDAEDDADPDARLTLDPGLDLIADPEAEESAVGQCKPGAIKTFSTPNGICGGCVINGSYPGQKMYNYYRYCEDPGIWSGAYPANPPTSCEHC